MNKVQAGPIQADRLKSFIERIENVDAEIVECQELKRDIYSEAKGVGYDVKTMRKVVSLRKMDAADRDEQETLLDVYMHALGMVDRIEARAAAGESARQIAAAEGVSKSTAHRVSQKARIVENGTGEGDCGPVVLSTLPGATITSQYTPPQPEHHSTSPDIGKDDDALDIALDEVQPPVAVGAIAEPKAERVAAEIDDLAIPSFLKRKPEQVSA